MAVKTSLYDALEYAGQVEEAAKSHRKEMKRKKEQEKTSTDEDRKTPNTGEFLSGFWKEDRLIQSALRKVTKKGSCQGCERTANIVKDEKGPPVCWDFYKKVRKKEEISSGFLGISSFYGLTHGLMPRFWDGGQRPLCETQP